MTATQILRENKAQIARNLEDFQAGKITYAEHFQRNAVAWDAIEAAGMTEQAHRTFHVQVLD
jgi:hypothetical protein